MDRIDHPTAVDIGGGRMGFRSKDTVAGVPGTVLTATFLNDMQEETMAMIELSGFIPDPARRDQTARVMRADRLRYLVAGGTANAITLNLVPAPLAGEVTAGFTLRVRILATNTAPVTLAYNGNPPEAVLGPNGRPLAEATLIGGGIASFIYGGSSWLLASWMALPNYNKLLFPAAGAFSWVCPAGIFALEDLALVGAGGAGGNSGTSNSQAGGGGGGGVARKARMPVTPGTTYNGTIGAGGVPSGLGQGYNGAAGGSSSFAGLLAANGGPGGLGANNGVAAVQVAGGGASGGDINLTGSIGTEGRQGFGGAAPGYSSPTPRAFTNAGNNNPGSGPGAGGPGGNDFGGAWQPGGAGEKGLFEAGFFG
jgi:hypothetical protein